MPTGAGSGRCSSLPVGGGRCDSGTFPAAGNIFFRTPACIGLPYSGQGSGGRIPGASGRVTGRLEQRTPAQEQRIAAAHRGASSDIARRQHARGLRRFLRPPGRRHRAGPATGPGLDGWHRSATRVRIAPALTAADRRDPTGLAVRLDKRNPARDRRSSSAEFRPGRKMTGKPQEGAAG